MSLLGKIANKEILNFLRTATIKNTYFAEKSRETQVKSAWTELVPTYNLPYTKHLAGEYVLAKEEKYQVVNPSTGLTEEQVYGATTQTLDSLARPVITSKNSDIFESSAFDEMMFVTSLDTQTTIPFTLENFYSDCALAAGHSSKSIHSKTLAAYRLPSRYYELLCERYPKQVDLIKAIVYRVPDKETHGAITLEELKAILYSQGATPHYVNQLIARYPTTRALLEASGMEGLTESDALTILERRRINIAKAKNFELLAYDDSMLDENERTDLVMHIKSVLNIIQTRWDVKEYTYEENYANVLWTMMWSILPIALIAKRYANIKTPNVSNNHMWDYLISKGLESYKGYLTTKQTLFLYKNIEYIHSHRGQQHSMNILIDNLLNDIGLTLKSKTVVLDTTDMMEAKTRSANYARQCKSCARCNKSCFKNITEHFCEDWQGTKELCRAEPVVLTEDFAGASKDKIITDLVMEYGYTQEEAEIKYKRSFIWKDDIIEKIKNDLNRDQLVDQSGRIESLEDIITRENKHGLEPALNEEALKVITEDQTSELQHCAGTYVPTKLLEMKERTYNVKFADMFNRFITDTFLRFAPYTDKDGNQIKRITDSYKFITTENSAEYFFDYGEMLAAIYLGFTREHNIDIILDNIQKDAQGRPARGPDGKLLSWAREIIDVNTDKIYDFPIPNSANIALSFKFGRPVRQDELYQAWWRQGFDDVDETHYAAVTNKVENTKIVTIRGKLYAIAPTETPEQDIWYNYPIALEILGEFVSERIGSGSYEHYYFENNGEIPIIPEFFKWHSDHLSVDDESTNIEEKDIKSVTLESLIRVDAEEEETPVIKDGKDLFDTDKKNKYFILRLSNYLDVDTLIDDYVDTIGGVGGQEGLGAYLTKMFTILEKIICFASGSGSVRTHLACKTFLNCVLVHKQINFDLVSVAKNRECKAGKCAWFSDWFKANKEATAGLKVIDKATDSSSVWNEFTSIATKQLLEGCTLSYANNTAYKAQLAKLKKLLRSLSSYRVNMIDTDEEGGVCNETAAIVEDSVIDNISVTSHEYHNAIGDSICHPHAGAYLEHGGIVYVPTHDPFRIQDKTYYVITDSNKELEDFDGSGTAYKVFTDVEVGEDLPMGRCYERINLYDILGISGSTPLSISTSNGKWYYRTGIGKTKKFLYPSHALDENAIVSADKFLGNDFDTPSVRKMFGSTVYRTEISAYDVTWGPAIESKDLAHWLQPTVESRVILSKPVDSHCEYHEKSN